MKKKLFDLEFDENYELIQEGSVRDPLMFYDDEEVVQEADENIEVDTTETVEEPAVEEPTEDVKENPTDVKTINVIPLEKVGEVSFGMNRSEVRNIFGNASEFNKSSLSKNTTDDFGFCHVFYNDDKCEAVELFNTVKVIVNGTSIFDSDVDTVKRLFPDAEDTDAGFISKEMSVGVYAPENQIESILFGCKGYYDSTAETVESSDDVSEEEPTTDDVSTSEESTEDVQLEAAVEEPRTEETIEEDVAVPETEEVASAEDVTASDDVEEPSSNEGDTAVEISVIGEPSTEGDNLENSVTPEGDDLSNFGTDTSDVQNEYDPKEIEILNKLIAAEGEAINDYFDAAKDSHDSNARRLYSDIGHEERFHMEQLLFQKAQFTGEKYEPRDPEVKKEYEELLQMGMDDETAMNTAVNKVPSPDDYTTDFVEYANDLSNTVIDQAAFIIETAKYMWEHRADKSIRDCGVVLESHFYQEEMINMASSQNKKDAQSKGPLKMIADAFKAVLKSLSNFTKVVRGKEEERRLRNKRRREWIQKNGWEGLFKGGRSFYFYSPKDDAFNMVYPCQYVDLLYRLSVDIGKKCGVTPTKEGYHGTMKNPIRYNSIEDGMAKIKNLKPTATKIVITDKNKDALLDELFGYSDKKIDVAMWNEELNRAIYESNNVYNKITAFQCVTKQYAEVSNGIYDVMDNLQNNANSIAWKDKITYNKYMKWMSEILAAYTNLLNAAQKDLEAMDSIPDSGDVKGATASRDMGNKLPEGEPDRRTSGSNGNNAASNKYAKSKK